MIFLWSINFHQKDNEILYQIYVYFYCFVLKKYLLTGFIDLYCLWITIFSFQDIILWKQKFSVLSWKKINTRNKWSNSFGPIISTLYNLYEEYRRSLHLFVFFCLSGLYFQLSIAALLYGWDTKTFPKIILGNQYQLPMYSFLNFICTYHSSIIFTFLTSPLIVDLHHLRKNVKHSGMDQYYHDRLLWRA